MADWLTGLVQGFGARKSEIEQQNLQEGLRMRQREGQILQALSASPDPEVRSLAIAGLLDSAGPAKRKSGLQGWIGQTESSPYLSQIRALSPTVTREQTMTDVPTQQGYIPATPPQAQPAAQPTTNPTVQGPDGAAWITDGGLNAKGRAAYNRANGANLQPPQPEGGPRRDSFCARMQVMKEKLTSKETANDPNSRINKSLRAWNC